MCYVYISKSFAIIYYLLIHTNIKDERLHEIIVILYDCQTHETLNAVEKRAVIVDV